MNDLTNLPPASAVSRPTWNALSDRLRGLLHEGRHDVIAGSPAMLSEALAALPALHRDATWGASAAEVMAVLAPRFALYPQPDRTDGEWDAWWAEYTHALDDIPPCAIEAGMDEYIRLPDSEFFPKPGKIRELAKTAPNRLARAINTAQRAIRQAEGMARADQVGAEPQPEMASEADKAQVRRMMADFAREIAARSEATRKPTLPPVSGPVDQGGLTQAMRDHMANRDQRT